MRLTSIITRLVSVYESSRNRLARLSASSNRRRLSSQSNNRDSFQQLEPRQLLAGDVGDQIFSADFEDAVVAAGSYELVQSASGFTATKSTFEVQNGVPSFSSPGNTTQFVELDGTSGMSTQISTVAGRQYVLQLQYSPRPGVNADQNSIEVWWNGNLIQTLSRDGKGITDADFREVQFILPSSNSSSTTLEFRSNFRRDKVGLGGLLDNIRVFNTATAPIVGEIGNQTVAPDDTLQLVVDLDNPSEVPEVSYTVVNGPVGIQLDPDTGELAWVASASNIAASNAANNVTSRGALQSVFFADFEDINVPRGEFRLVGQSSGFTSIHAAPFEIQNNHAQVGPAAGGNNLLELDGTNGVMTDIATTSGNEYVLTLDYSARPKVGTVGNTVEVWWDGQLVASFSDEGFDLSRDAFRPVTVELGGFTGDLTKLELRSNDPADTRGLGGLVDNVRVSRRVVTTTTGIDGEYQVVVRATTPGGQSDLETFTITVDTNGNGNSAPVVSNPINNQVARPDADFSFFVPSDTFTDPDGDTLTFSASGLPAWMSFDPATSEFFGSPVTSDIGSSTITVTATDPEGAQVTSTFDVNVTNDNSAPIVDNGIADQTSVVDIAFSFTVPADAFSDPDGDALTFTATGLPGWLTFDTTTATFSGTPTSGDTGDTTITVIASDPFGEFATTDFNMRVNLTNSAPIEDAGIPDQTIVAGNAFSLTVPADAFSDPDGDTLTFSTGTLPAWLTFDTTTSTFTGTPTNSDSGTVTILVVATDPGGGTGDTIFDITVQSGSNSAPLVDAGISGQMAIPDTAFSFIVPSDAFSDPDGDTLTLSAAGMPAWLAFDDTTNTFSGTPATTDLALTSIAVTATDPGGLSVSTTFVMDVSDPSNIAPVVVAPIGTQSAKPDELFTFVVPSNTFADADGDVLVLSATGLPGWLSFDDTTNTFSGTPAVSDLGITTITLTATDPSNASVSTTFDVEVDQTNNSPVVDQGIPDQIAAIDQAFSFVVPNDAFFDPDGDALTLAASSLPSWLSFDDTTNTFSGTPQTGDGGVATIVVSATDPGGLSVQTAFALQVNGPNQAPVVDQGIANQTASVASDFLFLVPADAFSDPDGDALTLSTNTLPSWLTFDDTSNTFSGTPALADLGTFTVTVTATDPSGASVDETFDITVETTSTNAAPEVDQGIGTQIAQIPDAFSFTVPADAFVDPDGDTLTLSTSALPAWLSFDDTTNTFSGTPMVGDGGTFPISVTATDPGGLSANTSFNLQVRAQSGAPVVDQGIADQNATADVPFSFIVPADAFSDPNGDALTLSTGALPAWLTFDDTTNTFSGTPGVADVGTVSIDVTATDPGGASVTDTFDLTVGTTTNTAPFVDQGIATQVAQIPDAFSFTVPANAFGDAEGDVLTLSTSALPAWLSFDDTTNTFSGTPMVGDGGTFPITVTATDPGGLSANTTFDLQVLAQNGAPVIDQGIADQNATADSPFAFMVPADAFSDPNGDALTLSTGALPAWLTFDDTTNTFTGTPGVADVGTVSIDVTATDPGGASVTDTFDLTVNTTTNMAPIVDQGIATQVAQIPDAFSFTVPADAFSDPDGDTLTLSTSALPAWLSFDDTTNTFSGTPMVGDGGTFPITVTATDPGGLSANTTFDLQVLAQNGAPVVDQGIADQNVTADSPYSFIVPADAFSDPDGDVLTLSTGALPAWLTFDDTTNTFSGTPGVADVGTVSIDVTATDPGGASVTDTFDLTVSTTTNTAPFVDQGIVNQTAQIPDAFSFTVPVDAFGDADGDTLTLSTSTLPAWLSFDDTTNTFSGTPMVGDDGTFSITVTATDPGGLSANTSFDLQVLAQNSAPVVDQGIADQNATADSPFAFMVPADAFSDPDGDTLTLSTSTLPAWLTFDDTTNTFTGTPGVADAGTVSIDVTATDPDGASVTDTFDLNVNTATNSAPVVDQGISQQIAQIPNAFSFTVPADAFSDPDGDTLTLSTSTLPTWLSFDDTTNTFSGTPMPGDGGTEMITVTATDPGGLSVQTSFNLQVQAANNAPVVDQGISQQFAQVADPFSFTVPGDAFSDPDGDVLTLSTSTLPTWLSFDDITNTFSGTPMTGDGGTEMITVTATDPGGLAVQTSFNLQVQAGNNAPIVDQGIADQNAVADTAFSFTVPGDAFSDPDGDTLTLSTDTLPAWLTFDDTTNTFSGTPGVPDVGTVTVTVTATDPDGAAVSDTFDIVVSGSLPTNIALSNDTGSSSADRITSDPAIAGQIDSSTTVTTFTARIAGGSDIDLLSLLDSNNAFTLNAGDLGVINGNQPLSEGLQQFVFTVNGSAIPFEFTLDTTPPDILAGPDQTAVANTDVITLEFSEDVDDDTLDSMIYALTADGNAFGIQDIVRVDEDTINLILDDVMVSGVNYVLVIDPGWSDIAGNSTTSNSTFNFNV